MSTHNHNKLVKLYVMMQKLLNEFIYHQPIAFYFMICAYNQKGLLKHI